MKKISYDCIYKCQGGIPDIKLNKESAAMKIYLRVNPFCISVLKSSLNPKAPKMLTKTSIDFQTICSDIFKASGDNADDQSDKSDDCILDCVEDPYIFKRGHAFVLDD